MNLIRKNNVKYKSWLIRHTKKKFMSRIRKGKHKRNCKKRISDFVHDSKEIIRSTGNDGIPFEAPPRFSIFGNTEETLTYFESITRLLRKRSFRRVPANIFIDIKDVIFISADSIMYLIAIIKNIKTYYIYNHSFSGNYPRDENVRNFFKESGFLKFVNAQGNKSVKPENSSRFKMFNGKYVDVSIAQAICDYACTHFVDSSRNTRFLYSTLIELMSNTKNHAYVPYPDDALMIRNWYIFIETGDNVLQFVFLDTGEGIANTVTKRFLENINIFKKDCDYIYSALKGEELRSATGQSYRGNGLPWINDYIEQGCYKVFKIISNKGQLEYIDARVNMFDNKTPLSGTLFYWEIEIRKVS